jgi:hypothetical protein
MNVEHLSLQQGMKVVNTQSQRAMRGEELKLSEAAVWKIDEHLPVPKMSVPTSVLLRSLLTMLHTSQRVFLPFHALIGYPRNRPWRPIGL